MLVFNLWSVCGSNNKLKVMSVRGNVNVTFGDGCEEGGARVTCTGEMRNALRVFVLKS